MHTKVFVTKQFLSFGVLGSKRYPQGLPYPLQLSVVGWPFFSLLSSSQIRLIWYSDEHADLC
jgi:hypothetical protein